MADKTSASRFLGQFYADGPDSEARDADHIFEYTAVKQAVDSQPHSQAMDYDNSVFMIYRKSDIPPLDGSSAPLPGHHIK